MSDSDPPPDDSDAAAAGLTRAQRHERRQAAEGYTRVSVRVHVDDVATVKAFAARLAARRKAASA